MKQIDECGHIFLVQNRPYLYRIWNGERWLFYWHKEGHWVSISKITEDEANNLPNNLSKEHQEIYQKRHDEWMCRNKKVFEYLASEQNGNDDD